MIPWRGAPVWPVPRNKFKAAARRFSRATDLARVEASEELPAARPCDRSRRPGQILVELSGFIPAPPAEPVLRPENQVLQMILKGTRPVPFPSS